MKTHSWHHPSIPTYRIGPPNLLLHVIFLQRQSVASRARVIERLGNVDKEWATQYDVSPRIRNLEAVPWIRDHWPSSDAILSITASAPDYKSFVLVDSGWEDGTVIATHWSDDEHGTPHLYAARVQMDVANVLLTLLDDGKVASFAEVLGEQAYEETKVDFYKDKLPPTGEKRKAQPYEPPSFLPKNMGLNKETIEIVALRELADEQIKTLTETIQGGTKRATRVAASTESVRIHPWQGESSSRFEMRQIYDWIMENSPEENRCLPVFFVDSLLEHEDHAPRIVAVIADKNPQIEPIRIFPLHTNRVLPYFEKNENEEENGMIWQQETLRPAEKRATFPDREDWGSEFTYHGYIFPSTSDKIHTLQDLADLFQKCDPASPLFEPNFSDVRFDGYPHHFVALDERVLDADNPTVIMASSLDFSNIPFSNDSLGWLHGTVEADHAHINFVNLDIANVGPDECFDDCKSLWMNDLKAHKKEAEERRQVEQEGGDDTQDERDDWVGMEPMHW
nr:hypothetical protein CFP56_00616 [Quercus suber]